jgi:hypothetical protein
MHEASTYRNADGLQRSSLAESLGPRVGPAASFVTTEHFSLQTVRAITVSEANGRANIYLAALSSSLIALAFVGQISRLGVAFYSFALILLPALAFVGVVTFLRLVQSSLEDIAYAHRIGLLRNFYLQLTPELERYFVVLRGAGWDVPFEGKSVAPSTWQLALTAAGMVAVVNSVVVAACAGLVLQAAGAHPLAIPVAVGALIGAVSFSLHERHHRRARDTLSPEAVDRVRSSFRHRNSPARPERSVVGGEVEARDMRSTRRSTGSSPTNGCGGLQYVTVRRRASCRNSLVFAASGRRGR